MTSESLRRVELQLDESDLRKLVEQTRGAYQGTAKSWQIVFAFLILYPAVPFTPFVLLGTWNQIGVWMGYLLALLLGGYLASVTIYIQRVSIARWVKSSEARRWYQPGAIELTSQRIVSSNPLAFGSYSWALVSEIERTGDRTYFWLGRSQAIVLPARAFQSSSDYGAFVSFAELLRDTAHHGLLSCPMCGYDLRANVNTGCPECGWGRPAAESPDTDPAR